jgi:hypothetical protein
MITQEINDFVIEHKRISVPLLQKTFNLSYYKARMIFQQLVDEEIIKQDDGLYYSIVEKENKYEYNPTHLDANSIFEKFKDRRPHFTYNDNDYKDDVEEDYYDIDVDDDGSDDNESNDDDNDDDNDGDNGDVGYGDNLFKTSAEPKESLADMVAKVGRMRAELNDRRDRLLRYARKNMRDSSDVSDVSEQFKNRFTDCDSGCDEDSARKKTQQAVVSFVNEIKEGCKAKKSSIELPSHDLWKSEEVFIDQVNEKIALIVKYNSKMTRKGAIKYAKQCVSDMKQFRCNDMAQVYERVIYEFEIASDYAYCKLRKALCGV